MSASSFKNTCLALLLAIGVQSTVHAQFDDPCSPFYGCSNDLRFFEPVDLDLDCQGCNCQCGFFFNYDKLAWASTGERVEVGDPNTQQRWFSIYAGTPTDPLTGQDITPPVIPNSIKNAVPQADFDTGDRYELGYWHENGKGWLLGILNGPDNIQQFTLGQEGGFQDGFQNGDALPFGDVFVAFRTDVGLLAGFIDLHEGAVGPGGGVLPDDDNAGGALDGDGIADDINNNGVFGPDGIPIGDDEFLIVDPDYGDLVNIPISFGLVNIRNDLRINGFEMMRAYRLDNSHFKVKHQNNHFEWGYGVRFLQLKDYFQFEGLGVPDGDWSIGDTTINQRINNNIVGPQVGYKWIHTRGRWSFDSIGKVLFGYNIRNWTQRGFIAEDATPSRNNHPLYIVPSSFSHGRSDSGFSPTAELRLNLNYRLTDNIKLGLGYTGTFVNNMRRASTHIDYVLYENGDVMGFRNVNEGDDIYTNGVNFHIEVTQ